MAMSLHTRCTGDGHSKGLGAIWVCVYARPKVTGTCIAMSREYTYIERYRTMHCSRESSSLPKYKHCNMKFAFLSTYSEIPAFAFGLTTESSNVTLTTLGYGSCLQ